MSAVDSLPTVSCPRCGYDLRGEIGRWTTRCPLAGACVECGLDLEWKDIHSYARHRWLFEAEWRYRPLVRIVATIANACRPAHFWRNVRMSDRIFLRPPAALLIGLFFLFYLVPVAWWTFEGRSYFFLTGQLPGRPMTGSHWPDAILISMINVAIWMLEHLAAPAVMLIGLPLAFLSVPVTLGRARVRPAHIARIALYSMLLPLLVATAWSTIQFALRLAGFSKLAAAIDPWDHYRTAAPGEPVLLVMLLLNWQPLTMIALMTLWLWWWWTCAFRHYLRFDGNRRVLVTMFAIAMLSGLIAAL